MIWICRGI
ncbi:unnamed protein product [Linum tenue]|uniref:Uncharacterized protein n=1 Tax=Linum tenue TaxID=586396 RepID=A0AAV0IX58_9ROSI|nr:unnamed protein product [Linum tenue]